MNGSGPAPADGLILGDVQSSFDPVEETIGLLEDAASAWDRAGRPALAKGHRQHAAGLRDLSGSIPPPPEPA